MPWVLLLHPVESKSLSFKCVLQKCSARRNFNRSHHAVFTEVFFCCVKDGLVNFKLFSHKHFLSFSWEYGFFTSAESTRIFISALHQRFRLLMLRFAKVL